MSSPGSPGVGLDTGSSSGSSSGCISGFVSTLWPWFSGLDMVALSFVSGCGSLCVGAASGV